MFVAKQARDDAEMARMEAERFDPNFKPQGEIHGLRVLAGLHRHLQAKSGDVTMVRIRAAIRLPPTSPTHIPPTLAICRRRIANTPPSNR